MKIQKIAFVCPIYPPHFDFARHLLFSFKENNLDKQADFWFVFTNLEESDDFGNYDFKLILSKENEVYANGGLINIKKMWALNTLQFEYEYIITLDSESLFIRQVDLLTLCNQYFLSKVLLGNKTLPMGKELTEKVKTECKEFFSLDNKSILDSELYLWFNQPCIYKTSNLKKFFEITLIDKKLKSLTWYHFDYYIYMYFLIIFEKFNIEDIEIESNYGVCEATKDPIFINSDKYKKLKIMVSSLNNLIMFNNPFLFLLIQLDR